MARKLRGIVEGRTLLNEAGDDINHEAVLRFVNSIRPQGEPEMTMKEFMAALAEPESKVEKE